MLLDTPTQGSITPTQHLLLTRENLNEIHDYSTIAHSPTRTQRPQMTSERVIRPLLKPHLSHGHAERPETRKMLFLRIKVMAL